MTLTDSLDPVAWVNHGDSFGAPCERLLRGVNKREAAVRGKMTQNFDCIKVIKLEK